MGADDLDQYEAELELRLFQEYRHVCGRVFHHVVETERRFYLANGVDVKTHADGDGRPYLEVTLEDAWVWDMYRENRFVSNVRIVTYKDVNVEELPQRELDIDELRAPEE